MIKNKKAQEEIVGFAIIVIIVSIILIFFLVFSLSDKTQVESYEAESFLQSTLQYTSSCQVGSKWLDIQDLIVACNNEETCSSGEEACVVLNETMENLVEESWSVGSNFPTKGYRLEVFSGNQEIFLAQKGNVTGSYKGARQLLPEAGAQIEVLFRLYS